MRKKASEGQLLFEFAGKEPTTSAQKDEFTRLTMRRAVLGWLIGQQPNGVGVKVPTRFSAFQADLAAFWSQPKRKLLKPAKTVIVEIRPHRNQCWPDCAAKDELLPLLRTEKERKKTLETEIRKKEPELRETDTLFKEFESWRYQNSKNPQYRQCVTKIEELEHALYKGSRFEQIRRAHVANYLYLAVPPNTVHPHELADGWGLLTVKPDWGLELVKEAEKWDCPEENQFHLIQNIAAANLENVLFAHGIRHTAGRKLIYTPIPHRRWKAKK